LFTRAHMNDNVRPPLYPLHTQSSLPKPTLKRLTIFFFLFLLSIFHAPFSFAEEPQKILIKEISVKGNRKIEEATIRYKMKTKVGEEFSVEKLREDVKALYSMGYFDQVAVDAEGFEGGLKLTVLVKEKPYIKEIVLKGNEKLESKKILEKVDLPLGSIANPLVLNQNGEKIRLFYEEEGYYQVAVKPIVDMVSENEAKVVFQINEGEKFEVTDIVFSGNKAFSPSKLRKQMKTKELFLFFFYGTLKGSDLKADADRLKAFYLNNGYLDVKIGEPQVEIEKTKKSIRISIHIEEGPPYTVGEVTITGNTVFDTQKLLEPLKTKQGEVFSYEALQRDIFSITDKYGEKGYIFADVSPLTSLQKEKLLVDIKLSVQEGKQMKLERLEISGNTRTRDNVIRREFRLAESEIFDSVAVRKGKDALNYLGFFEEVNVDTTPGSAEDSLMVKVGVKEKMTGTFSLGGGYGSVDGVMGMAQIAETNFLGRGLRVSLTAEISQRRNRFDLAYFDPRVFDTDNSVGLNIYNQDRIYPDWDEGRTGGSITYGRPLRYNFEGFTTYRYEKIDISGVSHDAPSTVADEEGKSSISSLTFALVRDLRDNRLDPTKGYKNLFSATYGGGILGGTKDFMKCEVDSSYYKPLFWKVVGVLHGNLGYGLGLNGEELALSERYFLGGPTTVRGFEFRDIGPTEHGTPIGGNKSLCFNVEMIFPLYETFKGVVFYDMGNAWDESHNYSLSHMRKSIGGGIRFFSPLGPIRLEYGFKLDRKSDEKMGELHFSVGAFF
jgi:outer membrane protein insertion porin family